MNTSKLKTMDVRHKVGFCPACRDYLWGVVVIETTVSPPTLTEDGKAHVYASAKPVSMHLDAHDCERSGE